MNGSSGGSSTPVQSTTTQKSEPWDKQKGYLEDVFKQAQARYYGPNPIDVRTGLPANQGGGGSASQWSQQGNSWVDQYGNTVGPTASGGGGGGSGEIRIAPGEGPPQPGTDGGGGPVTYSLAPQPTVSYFGPNQQGGGGALDYSSGNYRPDPNGAPQYFPDSTVVPFSDQTQTALDAMEQRAREGSDIQREGTGTYLDTLQGNYLNSNPYFDQALNASLRPIVENYNEVVMPQVQSAFSKSGRYGANSHQGAVGRVTDEMFQNLGDVASRMSFQNYDSERNRQHQAALNAPEYAQQDYLDIGRLANVGSAYEGLDREHLEDSINRHNFNTSREDAMLSQYMGLVNGNFGGTTQTTQSVPYFRGNEWAGPVGAGLSAAGTLGGLIK